MDNKFIEEYANYIYGIAKGFNNYSNREDLIQAGFLGLIKAKNNFNEENNTKFTTYAYPYIIGEMCTLIRNDKSIRINRDITKLKNKLDKAINYLEQKLLRKPTNKELSQFLKIDEIEIDRALKTVNLVKSLDDVVISDGKEINLYDVIPDRKKNIDELIMLKEVLNNLDSESKNILLSSLNYNQTEIGNMFNMNQVQVSRRLTKIKEKIRSCVY